MSYKVGVIGAAGYAGAELVRLLLQHPEFDLTVITSNADAGTALADAYPAFAGASDLAFTTHDDPAVRECDLVFLAVPHTAAMSQVPALLDAGVTVVDLSADYRLSDKDVYEQWYGATHTSPELLATRSFGLPELFGEDIERAHALHEVGKPALVACAGCYPTATSPCLRARRPCRLDAGPRHRRRQERRHGRGQGLQCQDALLQRRRGRAGLQRGQAPPHAGDRADSRQAGRGRVHAAPRAAEARPALDRLSATHRRGGGHERRGHARVLSRPV